MDRDRPPPVVQRTDDEDAVRTDPGAAIAERAHALAVELFVRADDVNDDKVDPAPLHLVEAH